MLLDKYVREDPDFGARYGEVCEQKIAYNHAMIQWMLGNNVAARRIMRANIAGQWRRRVIYFTMLFPYEFALRARSLFTDRAVLHYDSEDA